MLAVYAELRRHGRSAVLPRLLFGAQPELAGEDLGLEVVAPGAAQEIDEVRAAAQRDGDEVFDLEPLLAPQVLDPVYQLPHQPLVHEIAVQIGTQGDRQPSLAHQRVTLPLPRLDEHLLWGERDLIAVHVYRDGFPRRRPRPDLRGRLLQRAPDAGHEPAVLRSNHREVRLEVVGEDVLRLPEPQLLAVQLVE